MGPRPTCTDEEKRRRGADAARFFGAASYNGQAKHCTRATPSPSKQRLRLMRQREAEGGSQAAGSRLEQWQQWKQWEFQGLPGTSRHGGLDSALHAPPPRVVSLANPGTPTPEWLHLTGKPTRKLGEGCAVRLLGTKARGPCRFRLQLLGSARARWGPSCIKLHGIGGGRMLDGPVIRLYVLDLLDVVINPWVSRNQAGQELGRR